MKPRRKLFWFSAILIALVLAAGIGFWDRPVSYFNRLLYLQMTAKGAHSHWVTVDGHRLHYYEEGEPARQVVLLIHGLGGRSEDWRNLMPYLVQAGYHVYTPDLPGYGRSDRPSDFSYSVPGEAEAVADFMNAVGLKQVDLGGWSMGGWIVQRVAAAHPDRVKKLILFDSAGIYEVPRWNTDLFTPTTISELDELDALLMPHPPRVPPFIARDILRTSRDHAWVIHRALSSMLTGKDATDALLPTLKMPVLIVWGAEDRIIPVTQAEKMHRLVPRSQLDMVAGCGHLAPVQCADRIAPQVVEFLRKSDDLNGR